MLSVEQAVETILSHVNILNEEEVPLLESLGRNAAEDVYAEINVPPWDSSAVDGYAVRAKDLQGASRLNPKILQVVETVKAGAFGKHTVSPGTAIRIMTGAPLPAGAQCVVRFEDTDWENRKRNSSIPAPAEIGIAFEAAPGAYIRKAGENVPRGSRIISKGVPIGPPELNLLASQGHTRVKLTRRPMVAIVATGEELTMPDQTLSSHRIYNGNSYSIAAQVIRCGGTPKILGIARDNKSALLSKIRRGMHADMIITSGGVSKGDYDLVKNIMAELGDMVFWQVKMTPGRPFAFGLLHDTGPDGHIRDIPHLALTGNPTAGMVNFEILVRPALLKMAGRTVITPMTVDAVMENPLENKSGSQLYVWVKLDRAGDCYYARSTGALTKGVLPSIALADGLAVVPEELSHVEKGGNLSVVLLNWR